MTLSEEKDMHADAALQYLTGPRNWWTLMMGEYHAARAINVWLLMQRLGIRN